MLGSSPENARRTPRSSAERVRASLVILSILVPATLAMAFGEENFPLTSAAMFARDAGPERPKYTMHWYVEDGAGVQLVVPTKLGLSERHFFLHFYGTSEADSPYPDTPSDASYAAFAARAERWFAVFTARYQQHYGRTAERVRLLMRQRGANPAKEFVVGVYDARSGRFAKEQAP
jgi:hypothetical protein